MISRAHQHTHIAVLIAALVLSLSLATLNHATAQQALLATVDDSVIGTAAQQFNYIGTHWEHCTNCGQNVGAYGSSNSWNATPDESLTIAFTGTQIDFYGVLGPSNGVAAVSVDGGAEVLVDFYAAQTTGDQLLWTSKELEAGKHTFTLRITGTHSAASKGNYIAPDRVDLYGSGAAFRATAAPKAAATVDQVSLDYRVIDADYSLSLDRLILLADVPSSLFILDPLTGQSTSVKLASVGKFISVSPDGNFAVVAHVGLITYIDLQAATIVKTFDFPDMITDIVLGNGWIYVEPQGGSFQKLTALEIATGKQSISTGGDFYYGTNFEMHPAGNRLYGATQGISSGGIVSVDVTNGTAEVLGEHQGNWYACGKLWVSQDGKRLFSGYGGVFRTAADWELDVTPNGRLAQMKYARYVYHSANAGLILAIPESRPIPPCPNQGEETSNRLLVYDYNTLALLKVLTLPSVGKTDKNLPSIGHFVFANAAGTQYYIVLQANENSGLLNDFAIAVGDLAAIKQ
ncbi:MAG: hypothetical protein KF716_30375 [Anaerolineae bacterium]|nr:hypothetical protein [Anaerolineae bacterium]